MSTTAHAAVRFPISAHWLSMICPSPALIAALRRHVRYCASRRCRPVPQRTDAPRRRGSPQRLVMEPAADAAVAISRFRAKNGWESCSDRKPSAAYRCGSMSGGSRFDARERADGFTVSPCWRRNSASKTRAVLPVKCERVAILVVVLFCFGATLVMI